MARTRTIPAAASSAPRETRARLLEAGAELFAARGYHGTTVRDIAARAGANVAAASYHFGSKQALYLGVLRTQFAELHTLLGASGAIPSEEELDRLDRAALLEILRSRVTTMLEFFLGPPPALHGTLMIREMSDPSEALPAIVDELVRPQMADVGRVLTRLAPGLGRGEIESCIFSIIGQVFFFRLTRPVQLVLQGRDEYPRGFARAVAGHVFEFSLGGLERLSAAERRKSRAR